MLCCITGQYFQKTKVITLGSTISLPQSLKANIGLYLIWYVLSWELPWYSGLRFNPTQGSVLCKNTFWCLFKYPPGLTDSQKYPQVSSNAMGTWLPPTGGKKKKERKSLATKGLASDQPDTLWPQMKICHYYKVCLGTFQKGTLDVNNSLSNYE